MTRIDLTKGQCSALAEYLRGLLNSGMGAGCFGKSEMLVLAHRALLAAEEEPEDSDSPVPPLSPQKGSPPPTRRGAVQPRQRSSSVQRWRGWKRIVGAELGWSALRLWQSCVARWTASPSRRSCWGGC